MSTPVTRPDRTRPPHEHGRRITSGDGHRRRHARPGTTGWVIAGPDSFRAAASRPPGDLKQVRAATTDEQHSPATDDTLRPGRTRADHRVHVTNDKRYGTLRELTFTAGAERPRTDSHTPVTYLQRTCTYVGWG